MIIQTADPSVPIIKLPFLSCLVNLRSVNAPRFLVSSLLELALGLLSCALHFALGLGGETLCAAGDLAGLALGLPLDLVGLALSFGLELRGSAGVLGAGRGRRDVFCCFLELGCYRGYLYSC